MAKVATISGKPNKKPLRRGASAAACQYYTGTIVGTG